MTAAVSIKKTITIKMMSNSGVKSGVKPLRLLSCGTLIMKLSSQPFW
ncbi:hypothetical protein D036_1184 [Vibrio parahaemolyticus VP232]|nr:hypothetical protein D036_1184 [Vibrio parahaemolyticus VP232]